MRSACDPPRRPQQVRSLGPPIPARLRGPGHRDTGTQSLGAEAAGMKSTSAPELEVLSPISVITAGQEKPIPDVHNLRMCEFPT